MNPFNSNIDFCIRPQNTNLESNLEGLASVLEGDLGTFRAKVLRILTDCAIKLPEKCTVYSTLVGLLNVKNYNFGGEVMIGRPPINFSCITFI